MLAAVSAVRNFLRERQGHTTTSETGIGSVGAGALLERRRLHAAERYMSARMAGRNEDVLRLVAEDIELESSRDGRFAGKEAFRRYLGKVKATGTWKAATWNRAIGKAEILGNVRILMVNIGVVAHLGFNRAGKINRIYVGTRRKTVQ